MMKIRVFENGLVIKYRKSAIIFENVNGKKEKEELFIYTFTEEGFKDFVMYVEEIAGEAWSNVVPKEATSAGADYDEYYDRKYDANGNLSIKSYGISIVAPYWSVETLYQFNKPKIQSFIYDLKKKLK